MTANEIFRDSRVARVRELKAELAGVKEELARVRTELEELRGHFALALLAAGDAGEFGEGDEILIVDGWNAAFNGAGGGAPAERRGKVEAAARRAAEGGGRLVWVVFDGAEAGSWREGNLRVTYTGGRGAHRADRMVCDFLRMLGLAGNRAAVKVATNDKDFGAEARRLGAEVTRADGWQKEG